jgi:DNA helicase-2/ATP-dependent DNA helicase PcrA
LSNFFKNRFKSKLERKEKFKEKFKPLDDEVKKKRTFQRKKLSMDEVNELFDEEQSEKLIASLNEEQKEAALSPNTHNLVIASAGTGKTSTIVARVVNLLKNNTHPNEIMLITFTSKAAEEMKERIQKYIPATIAKEILIGTFHATAIILLKQNNIEFNLQTEKTLIAIFASIYHKTIEHGLDTPYKEKTLFELYSVFQAKRKGKDFRTWFMETYPKRENQFQNLEAYQKVFDAYAQAIADQKIVGFNELLEYASIHANKFKEKFKEIIIDEYQDTSYLQTHYIQSLDFKQLFCVGDYDQSIYAFNGADIEIIGSFKDVYPDASVINLAKNYRSAKPILDLAQKSIEINPRLYPKKLEITKTTEDLPVEFLSFESSPDQYLEVAKMISESKTHFDEIAVLYRNNASANGIEMALRTFNIDVVRDDKGSFLEIDEMRYMVNLLKLTNTKDKLPLIEILNSFSLNKFSSMIVNELTSLSRDSIKDALLYPKGNYKFSAVSAADFNLKHPLCKKLQNPKIGNLFYHIYRMLASHKRLNLDTFLEDFFSSELLEISMKKFAEDKSSKKGEFDREIYEKLMERYRKWKTSLLKTITAFDNLEVFLKAMGQNKSKDEEESGVRLLSVHASKGLEFEEVYLIDMTDKKFPNRKLMDNGGGGIEEERRLFYVAVTRAKEKLIITWSRLDGKGNPVSPSQFIEEISQKEEIFSNEETKPKKGAKGDKKKKK